MVSALVLVPFELSSLRPLLPAHEMDRFALTGTLRARRATLGSSWVRTTDPISAPLHAASASNEPEARGSTGQGPTGAVGARTPAHQPPTDRCTWAPRTSCLR